MKPSDVSIDAYDFALPPERIAQQPSPERDAARLLVFDRASGALSHRSFRELPDLLRPGDLLVLNRSRVFPARLLGTRPGGGAAEILLVRRLADGSWTALLRPARRLRPGTVVAIAPGFTAEILQAPSAAGHGFARVGMRADDVPVDEALSRHGHVPLPPYIRRSDAPADRERYQTVYAAEPGSVAAPTAGLHFTAALLARLAARGVGTASVVLHVGPGTFRPVEVSDVREHTVASEAFRVPDETAAAVNAARAEGRRVIAVGTTATRVLETATDERGHLLAGEGETSLVAVPGYRFRAIDALVTNFHLPRSSLLLLVAAFAGREKVIAAYAEAVRENYRFYSYGDAMLLL